MKDYFIVLCALVTFTLFVHVQASHANDVCGDEEGCSDENILESPRMPVKLMK
jgi:hypothetical protein